MMRRICNTHPKNAFWMIKQLLGALLLSTLLGWGGMACAEKATFERMAFTLEGGVVEALRIESVSLRASGLDWQQSLVREIRMSASGLRFPPVEIDGLDIANEPGTLWLDLETLEKAQALRVRRTASFLSTLSVSADNMANTLMAPEIREAIENELRKNTLGVRLLRLRRPHITVDTARHLLVADLGTQLPLGLPGPSLRAELPVRLLPDGRPDTTLATFTASPVPLSAEQATKLRGEVQEELVKLNERLMALYASFAFQPQRHTQLVYGPNNRMMLTTRLSLPANQTLSLSGKSKPSSK
jgi:hypothetical protein